MTCGGGGHKRKHRQRLWPRTFLLKYTLSLIQSVQRTERRAADLGGSGGPVRQTTLSPRIPYHHEDKVCAPPLIKQRLFHYHPRQLKPGDAPLDWRRHKSNPHITKSFPIQEQSTTATRLHYPVRSTTLHCSTLRCDLLPKNRSIARV